MKNNLLFFVAHLRDLVHQDLFEDLVLNEDGVLFDEVGEGETENAHKARVLDF